MNHPKQDNESTIAGHVRGSVLLVGGRLLAIIINFLVQLLTVRYLSKAEYGTFAFALSVAGILSVVSSFGMDKAASRFLAVYLQQRDYARFWGMFSLMGATVVGLGVCGVAIFVLGWMLRLPILSSDSETQLVLVIIAGLAVCTALDGLFIAMFAVLASPAAIFLRRHLLGPLLKLAAALLVILAQGGIVAFAWGQFAAAVIGVAICISMLTKALSRQSELRNALAHRFRFPLRELYSYSGTLLSGDLAYLVRGALVPVMLGILFADEEVAAYQSVVPVARLNELVLLSFSVLFVPQVAKLVNSKRQGELQSLFEKTSLWVTLLSFPIFALSFVGSGGLPAFLFGQEYRSSGPILAWLALGFYINASFGTSLRLLRAAGTLRTLLTADIVLTVFALVLMLCLLPSYGALGGAWAVCAIYFTQSILYHSLVFIKLNVNSFAPRCVGPFVAGVGLCVGAESLGSYLDAGLIPLLMMAAVISLVFLVWFGRGLDVSGTFPELARLPIMRQLIPLAFGESKTP